MTTASLSWMSFFGVRLEAFLSFVLPWSGLSLLSGHDVLWPHSWPHLHQCRLDLCPVSSGSSPQSIWPPSLLTMPCTNSSSDPSKVGSLSSNQPSWCVQSTLLPGCPHQAPVSAASTGSASKNPCPDTAPPAPVLWAQSFLFETLRWIPCLQNNWVLQICQPLTNMCTHHLTYTHTRSLTYRHTTLSPTGTRTISPTGRHTVSPTGTHHLTQPHTVYNTCQPCHMHAVLSQTCTHITSHVNTHPHTYTCLVHKCVQHLTHAISHTRAYLCRWRREHHAEQGWTTWALSAAFPRGAHGAPGGPPEAPDLCVAISIFPDEKTNILRGKLSVPSWSRLEHQ